MDMTVDELNQRFAVSGAVTFLPGAGGLSEVVLSAKDAQAHLMLHGAHVTSFQPAGQSPVLWVSRKSWFEADKPIRGGVPICLPWFGNANPIPNAPGHGIARLRQWEFVSARVLDDGRVEA